jgi:hypothetical protein
MAAQAANPEVVQISRHYSRGREDTGGNTRIGAAERTVMQTIHKLWHSANERDWLAALDRYMALIRPKNPEVEWQMELLEPESVQSLGEIAWYDFLHDSYFVWKYTASNRLATTRKALGRYHETETLSELQAVKRDLFSFDRSDVHSGLQIATRIRGLGVAGASGLLSVLFPSDFGTVDQFAVKALRGIPDLPERARVAEMQPDSLTVRDGVLLIEVMRRKATSNNGKFASTFWTPRRIDKILWTFGH